MSITLTPLFTDDFHRANENPLANPPWSLPVGSNTLQIVSDVCECTQDSCNNTYEGALPDDQYASATIAGFVAANNPQLRVYVRQSGDLGTFYELVVTSGSFFIKQLPTDNVLLFITGTVAAVDDVWTVAAIGTTLYVLQNGTQVGSVSDSSIASGGAALGAGINIALSDITYSLFVAGSAAVPPTVYSVPDCRDYGNFPNDAIDVQGTETYTVPSVDSRAAGAPVDSRKAGAPVDSRKNAPQNSRSFPPFDS
jgi:hypothetical protein